MPSDVPVAPLRPAVRHGHPAVINPAEAREDGDPAAQLSFTALRAIVNGLSRVPVAVPPTDGDPTVARSLRLLATTFYDVWLITWPDGSEMGAHDHGGSRGLLQVVDGELIETFRDLLDRPTPRSRVLRREDVTATPPSFIHELQNRSGADATTMHAYSPPLADIGFFNLGEQGDLRPLWTSTVADRAPQASTKDMVRSGSSSPRPMGRRRDARVARRAASTRWTVKGDLPDGRR